MTHREVFFLEKTERHIDTRLEAIEKINQDGSAEAAFLTFKESLFLTIAKYSYGQSLELVKHSFQKALKALEAYTVSGGKPFDLTHSETYQLTLSSLSLALLFGEKTTAFRWLAKGQDNVIDRFLNLGGAEIIPTLTVLHPLPYKNLTDAFTVAKDGNDYTPYIQSFTENYFKGLTGVSWYNLHLKHSPQFFGYWAFELAVFARAMKVDDTSFHTNIYYPRDFVHDRLLKTWLDTPEGDIARKASDLLKAQKELEGAKGMLTQFFASAVQGKNPPEGIEQAMGSVDLLSGVLGLDADKLEDNPELLRGLFINVLGGMVNLSGDVVKLTDPDEREDPEVKAMLRDFKKIEKAFTQAGPLKLDDLVKEMPEELRNEIDATSETAVMQKVNGQFTELQSAMSELVADEDIELEQLMAGMEKLMEEYSGIFGRPVSTYNVEENVRKDLSKKLAEQRKKDSLDDFDWSSLWKKEE